MEKARVLHVRVLAESAVMPAVPAKVQASARRAMAMAVIMFMTK
jgi:hypothetical protein